MGFAASIFFKYRICRYHFKIEIHQSPYWEQELRTASAFNLKALSSETIV